LIKAAAHTPDRLIYLRITWTWLWNYCSGDLKNICLTRNGFGLKKMARRLTKINHLCFMKNNPTKLFMGSEGEK
jgi:hypothetical protein